MRSVAIATLLVLLVALMGGVSLHQGWLDVAASRGHPAWLEGILHYAMERSVQRHARGIGIPELASQEGVEAGLVHYRAMCEACHGAPGEPPSEIAEGLYPRPPQFPEEHSDLGDAELFWITKHGIQLTGMPGFGATHGDDELWEIVAAVKGLPEMDAQSYRPPEPDPSAPAATPGGDHDHHDHHH
jgi:mono/diheme cytochrome c family protein